MSYTGVNTMAATNDIEGVEPYAEEAPLLALFGAPAKTKILSVFVAERGRDLSKSEIARQAGIARGTVYDYLDEFINLGVVVETRRTQAGHSARYQLNEDSEIAERLYQLEGLTLRRLLEQDGAI